MINLIKDSPVNLPQDWILSTAIILHVKAQEDKIDYKAPKMSRELSSTVIELVTVVSVFLLTPASIPVSRGTKIQAVLIAQPEIKYQGAAVQVE